MSAEPSSPSIVVSDELHYAAIRVSATWQEMREIMGPTRQEVYDAVAAQGLDPAGPWFTHHFRVPTDSFDFEICVPVPRPILASGRVYPAVWKAMRLARTVYTGDFQGLGDAWGNFIEWIARRDLKASGELWERYVSQSESDPGSCHTELSKELLDVDSA
jgi:effector-binding domain-containing protein